MVDKVTLAGSGRGTARFQVGATESFRAREIWYGSTSTFSIETIKDQAGKEYTNADAIQPISNLSMQKPQVAGGGAGKFSPALTIQPAGYLEVGLLDTSASTNYVTLILEGELETTE
jgi:hypothetical protein